MKNLIIVVGPSGGGKTTLLKHLLKFGYSKIVSCTTRSMRTGEQNGIDYYFQTKEEFFAEEKVEYTEYAYNYYGISVKELEKQLEHNNCYIVMDIVGALKMKTKFPQAKIVFIYNDIPVLIQRMKERGDSEDSITERVRFMKESKELENYRYADIVIKTESYEKTGKEIEEFLKNLM